MSQNRPTSQNATQEKFNSFWQSYKVALIGGNAALLIGQPAERLKVAAQIKLNVPTWQVIKPLVSHIGQLYTGFTSCIYRQNIKFFYRTIIMDQILHHVDDLHLNVVFGSALKAFIASSIDTAFVTPAENVKTWQMRDSTKDKKVGVSDAISGIYQTRGFKGFFFGLTPTMTKSFPAWFYLFLGYHATKNKREKQGFLATIFWATCASIPTTILTNPIDVIKTQMQATPDGKSSSLMKVGKNIYQEHGLFAFSRGFPFRLLHKALATSTSYVLMDTSKRLKNKM